MSDGTVYPNPGGVAFDRASMRSVDMDGRLHIEAATVSMAAVNRYETHEIPGTEALDLDPGRTYALLRPPEELQRAAPTVNNVPVLVEHVPVDASDVPGREVGCPSPKWATRPADLARDSKVGAGRSGLLTAFCMSVRRR